MSRDDCECDGKNKERVSGLFSSNLEAESLLSRTCISTSSVLRS